jgi:hypothetical protein
VKLRRGHCIRQFGGVIRPTSSVEVGRFVLISDPILNIQDARAFYEASGGRANRKR